MLRDCQYQQETIVLNEKKSICETSKFGMNFGEVQVLSQYKERH